MRIYYARTDDLVSEHIFSQALKLLPACRLEKLSRMKAVESRKQCVAAGLLLEYGLREYDICSKNITFSENSDGKPYIVELPSLYYNLSHSGAYVALAMGDCTVGIDIEKVKYGQQRLAKRFFSEEEAAWLGNSWSDDGFTKIWTRKEAFIKAKGIGMRMPLAGFSTLEAKVEVNDMMPLEMQETNVDYYLISHQINDEYWLSVCQREHKVMDMPKEINIGDFVLCTMN